MKRAVWLLAATLVAGMASQVAPAAAQDGKWRMAKPMLAPQGEVVSVAIGKKWYVFGGYDGANVQARGIVNVYDAASDTWTEKKNMQIPAHHASAVELNGKIYVFGGFVGRPGTKVWQPISSAMMYDPEADSWKELAPMPTGRNHFYAGVVDGKIYAVNGRLGAPFVTMSDVTDLVEEYDPATDIWIFKGRSPTRRGDVAGAVYNGKLYVTGGEYEEPRGKVTFWAFEAYDPKTNSWQVLPHMQIARHGFVAGFIDNEFHVAGGSFQSDGMPGIFSQMATHEVFPVGK